MPALFEPGKNDLLTRYPKLAAEADGWDPSKFLAGSRQKLSWKCKESHTWDAKLSSRTSTNKTGCPYCSNSKCWTGFNDLKTLFPEIAKEAYGWDPSKVIGGTGNKFAWKCSVCNYKCPTDY